MVRLAAVVIAFLLLASTARADWNGDGAGDVLTIHPDGRLLMYRGNGAGGWVTGHGEQVGSGWQDFTALLAPGDFSGDAKPDVLARQPDGTLLMYRGNGAGGWVTGHGEPIGSGWQSFTALFAGGDFSGDGKPDVLARQPDGTLLMYRGNGAGGWVTGHGEPIGSGWQDFTALAGGGDFNGDGKPDVLARSPDGSLRLYRGTGAGGWMDNGIVVGSGWGSLGYLTLVGGSPAPPPASSAPAIVPLPGASSKLVAALGCTPPGGRLRVSAKIRHRRGQTPPHVRRVVFFVRGGPRRTDHRRPYTVHLKLDLPAGKRGRVYARIYFSRGRSHKVHSKTVSRTFTICG